MHNNTITINITIIIQNQIIMKDRMEEIIINIINNMRNNRIINIIKASIIKNMVGNMMNNIINKKEKVMSKMLILILINKFRIHKNRKNRKAWLRSWIKIKNYNQINLVQIMIIMWDMSQRRIKMLIKYKKLVQCKRKNLILTWMPLIELLNKDFW